MLQYVFLGVTALPCTVCVVKSRKGKGVAQSALTAEFAFYISGRSEKIRRCEFYLTLMKHYLHHHAPGFFPLLSQAFVHSFKSTWQHHWLLTATPPGPLSGSTATLMPSQRPKEPLQQLLLAGTCFTRGSSCSEGWQQAGQQLPDEPQRRALPTAGKRARRRRP